MAEVTGLRNSALPYPVYAAPYGLLIQILDADGDPVTGATGLDSEISKNGDTIADCTNEATEIGNGWYYLLLTATELTSDTVAGLTKTSTSGAKNTPWALYPRKLVTIRSGTSAGGASGSITLDGSASAIDDFYNGMLCVGTLDSVVEARVITDYVGSTKVATVTPNWVTTPDSDDTFIIYLPEGTQVTQANTTHLAGTAQTARDIGASVLLSSGTGTGQLDFTSGVTKANTTQFAGSAITSASGIPEVKVASIAANAITATAIASDAITDAKVASDVTIASVTGAVGSVASGGISAASFAAGAIDATAIAANAIGASELAADAVAEIADGVWDEVTSGHVTAGTFGQREYLIRANTAQAGASTTITLDASASATDDIYNNQIIVLTGGTGAGQSRIISDYVGSTKVATVPAWQTNPSSDSVFVILPFGAIPGASAPTAAEVADAVWEEALADHEGTAGSTAEALADAGGSGASAADIADAVWDEATAGHTTSGTFGEQVKTDVDAILADTNELQTDWVNGGRLDNILDARSSQTSVDDIPTNAELATALGTADDAVLAAIAALNNLSQANIRTAVGLATANLDTQLDALPTNAELATALGTADDAVLAAIAALNNLSQANIRTAVGLGSANLDTQLDALPTNAELATALAAADDAVLAAIAALNNLSSAQVTAAVPTAVQNADALLKRDFSSVTGEATRSALNALRFLRNKWDITAGTLTVAKEDDSTSAWTAAVTQTAGDPVSEIDPA